MTLEYLGNNWQQILMWVGGAIFLIVITNWLHDAVAYVRDWMENVRDSLKAISERVDYLWPMEDLVERQRDVEMAGLRQSKQPRDESKETKGGQ